MIDPEQPIYTLHKSTDANGGSKLYVPNILGHKKRVCTYLFQFLVVPGSTIYVIQVDGGEGDLCILLIVFALSRWQKGYN